MRVRQSFITDCLIVLVFFAMVRPLAEGVPRTRELIDNNWRFALGHATDPSKDFNFTTDYFYNATAGAGDGAAATDFDDRTWRVVNLPHDWAVELPFDSQGDTGHGAKRVGRFYPDTSIGWYRRALDIPVSDLGRRICVDFDGAFRDAQVFLNGHDVGHFASDYDGFRIRRLKEMGSNALRTSHNPPTPELLDACDRLGMLVLDENRRTGTAPVAMDGLRQLILRDRNHPSIFLWSLGNEEWFIESNIVGQRVVASQRSLAHKLDPSRLVTDAISGGWGGGTSNSVDVMGFNYFVHGDFDDYHKKHPDQPCIGSEEGSCTATRGCYLQDDSRAELAAYSDTSPDWAATYERWTNFYATRPFVAGAFVWTGFNYRGEATPFGWPGISSQFGILNTCGFSKDAFYYYQSCWTDKPMVHLLPYWNWPGKEGQPIDVRSYSDCDQVEILLNGTSLGRKPQPHLKQLKWSIPYATGTLTAIAYKANHEAARDVVQTSTDAVSVQLIRDRPAITADGRDVSVITVRAVDGQGGPVPTAHNMIHFQIEGSGKIIGVGTGDPACHEPDVYVEQVQAFTVSNWKSKSIADPTDPPEVADVFDDSGWKNGISDDDTSKTAVPRVYRAIVDIPDLRSTSSSAFMTHFGKDAQLFINGMRITNSSNLSGHLRTGNNTIAVVASAEKTSNPASQSGSKLPRQRGKDPSSTALPKSLCNPLTLPVSLSSPQVETP